MVSNSAAGHAHEWETSAAPLLIVLGILFAVVFAFSGYFVYDNILMTAIFAGLGVPILLIGISKWVSEGLEQTHLHFGYAATGMPIFIISEAFIFLTFFIAYWFSRLQMGDAWPPPGTPHIDYTLPIIMTVILVTSSFMIHIAENKLKEKDEAGFRTYLIITIILALVFVGCTFYEYHHLLGEGFNPGTNIYSTAFYSITGFHCSHVIIGASIFIAVLIPAMSGKINTTFVACAAVYWHFVDIIWFFVVSQVYFW